MEGSITKSTYRTFGCRVEAVEEFEDWSLVQPSERAYEGRLKMEVHAPNVVRKYIPPSRLMTLIREFFCLRYRTMKVAKANREATEFRIVSPFSTVISSEAKTKPPTKGSRER